MIGDFALIAFIAIVVLTVTILIFVLIFGEAILNFIEFIEVRKEKRVAENPLSEENKKLLSKKIENINAKHDELLAYVVSMLDDGTILGRYKEITDFRMDETIAKDFRNNCQKILDSGIKLDFSRVFDLEDNFFNEYRRLKVLKLAECKDVKEIYSVLYSIHMAASEMTEYLMSFSKGEADYEDPIDRLANLMAEVTKVKDQQIVDSDEWMLGMDTIRRCNAWKVVMDTGNIEEFSDTESILINLAINYLEVVDGKRSKEAFSKQLKKAERDILLLNELAKMRIENKDTTKEDLELDSWQIVIENTLQNEKLKI